MTKDDEIAKLRAAIDELSSINHTLDRVCHLRETSQILSVLIDELISLSGSHEGVISLISSEQKAETTTVIRKRTHEAAGIPFHVHSQLSGWVLANSATLKIDDLDHDDRFRQLSSQDGRFKAVLCIPLIVRGAILGLATLVKSAPAGPFSDREARVAGIAAAQSAQILHSAILLQELAQKNELLAISQRALREENARLKTKFGVGASFENIIGKSTAMRTILETAAKVAKNDVPLLITGETGTGKELLARAIHSSGPRRQNNFVVKNCGLKTETLLEAELFGYVKGAFTGAETDKPGLFQEADNGTIFLDEVGEAPPSTQVALLRVLESGEVRAVGASRSLQVNVRIISATNRDLKNAIKDGSFREDLYYRLNGVTIELPPLRMRREDIPLLIDNALKRLKSQFGNEDLAIAPDAMERLCQYSWPGNIRQLQHEIQRAAMLADDESQITFQDFSPEVKSALSDAAESSPGILRQAVDKLEADLIRKTLDENRGNILQTSKVLGLTRKGLREKMLRLGLKADDYRQ